MTIYRVTESDQAEAEREAAFLHVGRFSGVEHATAWYDGLRRAIAQLPDFPGPLSHAIDERATALFGREVRRMLYYGPTRRRSGTPYRVLFTVIPPAEGENEALIYVLRILHGAQEIGPAGTSEEDETP